VRGGVSAAADSAAENRIAVISETMAAGLWPGQKAIGKRFRSAIVPDQPIEVIGIVKSTKHRDGFQPRKAPAPQFYLSTGPSSPSPRTFYIRTTGRPESVVPAVRSEVRSI